MPNRRIVAEHQEWLDEYCWSQFEGCACMGDKNHDGLHWCDSNHMPPYPKRIEWTTEQADKWMKEILTDEGI